MCGTQISCVNPLTPWSSFVTALLTYTIVRAGERNRLYFCTVTVRRDDDNDNNSSCGWYQLLHPGEILQSPLQMLNYSTLSGIR